MFARTTTTLFALLGTASIFSLGCSGATQSSSTDDPASVQAALEQDNGGMTTTAEAPAFDDPQVMAVEEFSTANADTTDMTSATAAMPGATLYHVALLWGHLPPPDDANDAPRPAPVAVDWSGTVSVDQGAIGVKRTLAFDAHDAVAPRTSPQSVAFTSHTLPFVDGLFLHVVIPAGAAPTLHFQTAALNQDIDLSALVAHEGGVARLPQDAADGLGWIGYEDAPSCHKGLMFGHWKKLRGGLGIARGRVFDGDGETIGHTKAIWGHARRRDANVFFGKYIGINGEHRGLFGGEYGDGKYAGVWGTVDPKDAGTLSGVYSDGYGRDDDRGFYLGRWSERCGQ